MAAALPVEAQPGAPATVRTQTYQIDDTDFANPERGFSRANGSFEDARAADMSLAHVYFRLDPFKAAPLSSDFLEGVQQRFDSARAAGVKLIPRFIYNFPAGLPLKPGDEDAPLPIVLRHIGQLEPVLQRNADVIAFLEAGFIGAWGEWHNSTSGLEREEAKKSILGALLRALPAERAVALRYSRDKIAIFGRSQPLGAEEAFSGRPIARVGHHNDCFLAARDDWGTYRPVDAAALEAQKSYLAAESRFVPVGGETCNAGEEAQPFIACANAVAELGRLGWSQLNADYHPDVLRLWRTQGCHVEIAKRLGYRLRLISASSPATAKAGKTLAVSVRIANDGFAAPYNPRGLALILRDRRTGGETVVPIGDDPRRWGAGSVTDVAMSAPLPRTLAPGTYDLLLSLPDPAPALRKRADYAIRLANRDMWEAETGYNRLSLSIDVRR